jgi:hypothetical protein
VVRSASANLVGQTNGFFTNPDVDFSIFDTLITEGIHAEDPHPEPVAYPMPWQTFSNMELGDLQAVYVYLNAVATEVAFTGADDKLIPNPAIYCDGSNACAPGSACSVADGGPGECLANSCQVSTDCAVCQTCTAGACQVMSANALAACEATGY